MDTIPCPGCRTDLEPSATVCPICLRPRGKLEITRAYSTLREREKQRKLRPFVIAGRLLAAAAIGALIYRFYAPVTSALSSSQAFVSRFVDELLYPPRAPVLASSPAAPAAEAPAGAVAGGARTAFPAAAARPSTPSSSAPSAAPSNAVPVPKSPRARAPVEDLPLPSFDPSNQWAFYGRAFNLITLEPVADAQISFGVASAYRTGSDLALIVRTDADGRFVAVLRRLPDGGSYELHVSRAGYAAPVLYESDIPYATLPLADRREIVRSAQDGDVGVPPLNDISGETSLRRDVFLAPAR
jgi:hypothetical protein